MRNRKWLAIFGALLTLTVFFSGMVTYKVLSGSLGGGTAGAAASAPGHRDGVTIRGHLDLQVVRGGKVVATWKGHNALQPLAINAMAGCASGLTTAPAFVGKCSGWTPDLSLFTNGPCYGWCLDAVATNSGLPAGCNPAGTYSQICNGWQTSATVDVTFDTTVSKAGATFTAGGDTFDIVDVSPSLAVKKGDRVVTVISFTVS